MHAVGVAEYAIVVVAVGVAVGVQVGSVASDNVPEIVLLSSLLSFTTPALSAVTV